MQGSNISTEVRIGCSGWAYKHWRGLFYPEGLPQRLWFERYSQEFYVRFHGFGGKYWGRYPDEVLSGWADWACDQLSQGRSAWCYFNNDIHGHAIEDARTLKRMVQEKSA